MRTLLRLIFTLVIVFLIITLISLFFGLQDTFDYKIIISDLGNQPHWVIGPAIILLLILDLFFSIPTLALVIFSGHLMGVLWGGVYTTIGLFLSGQLGYVLGSSFGQKILRYIIQSEGQRVELASCYHEYGGVMILLSRSIPMGPEVCSFLAGINKMPWLKFNLLWGISILPYAFLVNYIGDIGSEQNKISISIGIFCVYFAFWTCARVYLKNKKINKKLIRRNDENY
jgi:uncharacterized membrane protein YdjX (TVP38/TMEM64 family)